MSSADGASASAASCGFAFIAAYTGFLLLPLYWMAVTSIKGAGGPALGSARLVPSDPTAINYSDALNNFNGWKGLQNSLIIAFVTTLFAVALGTAAAYSMARFRTGGKHLAFWFLSQRMMPPIAIIIPIFLLYSRYSEEWFGFTLIDTRLGLILLYTVFALPVHRLDDVRLLPADAARARGGGPRRRLLAPPGTAQDRLAARGAGDRVRGCVRIHLLVDRVPLRPGARP